MSARVLAGVAFVGAISACATTEPTALPVGIALRLAEVDGKSVGRQSFTLELRHDGRYAAAYNCGDHFGTYSYRERLTLRPGASTGKTCDQVDISSGKRIVYDLSTANDFFADPNFSVVSRRRVVELRNSRRTFRFVTYQ